MAVKYYSDFSDEAGSEWHVVIHDQDYGGSSPVEFTLGADGFRLIYEATDTERSQAVIPSTLEFDYIIRNGNDDALISAIAGSAEGRFQVEVYYGGSSYSAGHLYWRGVLLADIAELVDEHYPQQLTLLAIDDLAGLREDDFNTTNDGYANVSTIVSNCLNRMRCWDITSETNRATAVTWYKGQDYQGTYRDTWTHAQMNYALFKNTDDFPTTFMKTYEVLEGILSGFGSRIYWRPSIDSSVASGFVIDSINAQQYDQDLLTGYSINNSGTTAATTLTRQEINLNSTNVHRLRGFKKGFLNPLLKAERSFSYGSSPFIVDHEYSGVPDSNNFHDGSYDAELHPAPTVEYEQGSLVSLRFTASFNHAEGLISNQAFDSVPKRAGRFKISAKFKLGQYYADRNLTVQGTTGVYVTDGGGFCDVVTFTEDQSTWSTSSSNRIDWYTPPLVWTDEENLTFQMGIDLAPLPADLTSEDCTIAWTITPVDSDGNTATYLSAIGDLFDNDAPGLLKVTMYPTDIFQSGGSTITFKAENSNTDAREILALPSIYFSDLLGGKGGGLFMYANGTRNQPSNWQSSSNLGADVNLHNLVAREWVQGQSRNIKKMSGEVRDHRTSSTNGITLLDTITHSSESYSIHGLEFHAKRGIYRLDCLLLENSGTVTNPAEVFSDQFENTINTPGRPPVTPVTEVVIGEIQEKTDLITITQAVDLDSVESDVGTNSAAISEIQGVLKASTGGGGKGVYTDSSKSTTASYMGLSSTGAIMQAGSNTNVDLSESSPGTIDLNVQAGSSGSETQITAVSIVGDGAAQAARITMNEPVVFASSVGGISLDEMSDVDTSGKSTGQVLQWGGSSWGAATVSGGGGSSDVVDDTSPQLGGNLDLNSNDITGTGNVNITGGVTASGNGNLGGLLLGSTGMISLGSIQGANITATGNASITGTLTAGDATVANLFASGVQFVGSGTNTIHPANTGGTQTDLQIESNGNVTIVLDDDDDQTDQAFKIESGDGTLIWQVNESGVTSGLLTTATPTLSGAASSYAQASSVSGISVSNHTSGRSYEAGIYNSSGTLQTANPVTVDSSGNITFTAPSTAATGYELRIAAADVGKFKSPQATATFEVTPTRTFTYWRVQGVDSSGNASANKAGWVELDFFTGANATGTEYPTSDATSNTSISGVTISAGHQYSSSYAPWKAFDGTAHGTQAAGSMWWTLGNSTAANTWIQLQFSSAQTFSSMKLTVYDSFNDATHLIIKGSNTGSFSGEEVSFGLTAITETGSAGITTVNF